MDRDKARNLLSAVADNEVSNIKKAAFMRFIRHHPDIRREYEEILEIKQFLSENLQRHKAPDRLREKVIKLIDEMESDEER